MQSGTELLVVQQADERKRLSQEPDEDGFIKVTSKKRTPTVADEESANMKRKRKREPLEKPNFYRFQLREKTQDRTFYILFVRTSVFVLLIMGYRRNTRASKKI